MIAQEINVDVGGEQFVTSLDTLLKYPYSHLARITQKSVEESGILKRIFIDRDGRLFRHILNYCRNSKLLLPKKFNEMELLHAEAVFYDIPSLIALTKDRLSESRKSTKERDVTYKNSTATPFSSGREGFDCIMIHVYHSDYSTTDGNIHISARKDILEKTFPEIWAALANGTEFDGSNGPHGNWDLVTGDRVNDFPLKECGITKWLFVFERLSQFNFQMKTSYKGEKSGFHFSEYIFVRGNPTSNVG